MKDKAAFRVLLVEDDPVILEGIRDYFTGKEEGLFEVSCAQSGPEGLKALSAQGFDMILLDVMLPGMDGFQLMKEIRRRMDTPVIFITARTREEDRLYGYELGCDDYVCKPFLVAELYAKVKACIQRAKGETPGIGNVLSCGKLSVNLRTLTVMAGESEVLLAPKEYALLVTFLREPNRVFSREKLLDLVWGDDYDGFDRVVDSHIRKLRKALGDEGSRIKTVFSKGYKIEKE